MTNKETTRKMETLAEIEADIARINTLIARIDATLSEAVHDEMMDFHNSIDWADWLASVSSGIPAF